ncbi:MULTISPECIES: helix-turn-helix domain-containing protein [Acidianus]|uniref:RNA polymerase sigma70 n=1 Tax=Candidatus Acidianus copahuensis TaxID=1160895 RepID=A0A031LU89_9CREN|nr:MULTISPECIES: helix-turn-helix domain-containing protein [Acidianus]EZQ11391.1 RNA polymerase sigma70 [Candidatus Acidianus copahuensis]NON62612.1 RNA polymerase subunit sigma-70 [Acidianus sp. RZ1]
MKRGPIEATVVIENHPCQVIGLISELDLKASVENVKLGDNTTDHIMTFERKIDDEIVSEIKKRSIKSLRLSDFKVWVRTNGCGVCRLLYSSEIVVEKVKVIGPKTVLYTLLVLNNTALKDFIRKVSEGGSKVTVLNTTVVSDNELTERQKEILKLAYKLGYFDEDRKISLSELAGKLGISAPTLEEILRKALRKAVKYYLDKKVE